MSLTSNLDAPPQQRESAAATYAGWRVCIIVLTLFIAAASLSAIRKDVTFGYDEVAHVSYVAHLQSTHEMWPAFAEMRMLDASTFRFTEVANYLDHPPVYYWLLARIGPALEGHSDAVLFYRFLNVALAAIGLAAWMAIGIALRLPPLKLYAYVLPLACIPVLVPLAGAVNNDNAAFAGSGIAALAAAQLLIASHPAWLVAALIGVIIASWAKFTALLLTGGLVGGVLLWLLWHGRLPWRWIGPIAVAALLAGAPYIVFCAQYGNPVPQTPGQIEMIRSIALAKGWTDAPRSSSVAFVVSFLSEFVTDWMPTDKSRNVLNYAALAIPVATALCAFAGPALAVRRTVGAKAEPLDIIVVAGCLAFAATLMIHGIFAYRLHIEFGWLTSAYPRYYLPLLAIIPLANLVLLDAIDRPRARALLLGLLIAGPIIFRIAGAPFG
jgi:hypothetical protein